MYFGGVRTRKRDRRSRRVRLDPLLPFTSSPLSSRRCASRSSPRRNLQPLSDELYASAVRALMRVAYAIHEMRAYLERRTEDKEAVSTVVARLREQQYLDDARYALEYVRHHAQVAFA